MIIYILHDLEFRQSYCSMLFLFLGISLQVSKSRYYYDLLGDIDEKTFFDILKEYLEPFKAAHLLPHLLTSFTQPSFLVYH